MMTSKCSLRIFPLSTLCRFLCFHAASDISSIALVLRDQARLDLPFYQMLSIQRDIFPAFPCRSEPRYCSVSTEAKIHRSCPHLYRQSTNRYPSCKKSKRLNKHSLFLFNLKDKWFLYRFSLSVQ